MPPASAAPSSCRGAAAARTCCSPRSTRTASSGCCRSRRTLHASPARAVVLVRRRARTPTRAGRRRTATTGCATGAGYLEFFFARGVHRAALDEADRGRRRLGSRDRRRDDHCTAWTPTGPTTPRARGRCWRASRCPSLVVQGTADAMVGAARGAGRRRGHARRAPRLLEGSRPRSAHARPGHRQPADPRLRRPADAAVPLGARPRRARGGRSTSPRRSASATRDATLRSRESCAGCGPDLEIDWLAQHPVTEVLEAARRARPPGQRANWPASRGTSSASRDGHELHCFQALRRMDEILLANFMVFHDLVERRARTTCGSATRPGSSTTTCTRTRS